MFLYETATMSTGQGFYYTADWASSINIRQWGITMGYIRDIDPYQEQEGEGNTQEEPTKKKQKFN